MLPAPSEAEGPDSEPLTAGKGDPAGVFGGLPAPVGSHQESTGDREGDDAHDDEEQCGDPLGRQPRGDTGPVSSMDGLTLPDQPDGEGTCEKKMPLASCFTVKESRVVSRHTWTLFPIMHLS